MHSGQADILATVLLLSIIVISSLSAYTFFQSLQSEIQTSSTQSTQRINQLPPNIESAYTQPPTTEKKTTTLCSIIRNPNNHKILLQNVILYLYKNNIPILTETNTYNDCNSVVPPKGVCKVCAEVIIPEEGTYTYKFVYGSSPIFSQTLKVPKEHISLYPDLTVKSLSAYQNHYDSKTLLFGDYNSFAVEVTVCNDGRDDMNTTATLTLSATNASLSQTTFTVPILSPNECNTITTAGTTENYYDVRITARIDYPNIELTTRNNVLSRTFTNAYYDECNSCESCTTALKAGADRSLGTFWTYVVLTDDIEGNAPCIELNSASVPAIKITSGYKIGTGVSTSLSLVTYSTVVFDGHGHKMTIFADNDLNDYGLVLAGVDGLTVRGVDLNFIDGRTAMYLHTSTVRIANSHILYHATSLREHVGAIFAYNSELDLDNVFARNYNTEHSAVVDLEECPSVMVRGGWYYTYGPHNTVFYVESSDLRINTGSGTWLCASGGSSDVVPWGTAKIVCDSGEVYYVLPSSWVASSPCSVQVSDAECLAAGGGIGG